MSNTSIRLANLYRERQAVAPDREVCPECRGTGMDEWGCCNNCSGYGSWPVSDLHMRPDDEREAMAWADMKDNL